MAWLAALVACGLVVGTFTPIGIALTVPLEHRFAFSPPDSQPPPDGIILLNGSGLGGIEAMSTLSKNYPKARLIFSGFSAPQPNAYWFKIFVLFGGDPTRILPDHGRLPRTHFTLPRCSNQSPVKGGCWSLQPRTCRGLSDAFELPDFR
jgi:hypothetical protein